MLEWTFCISVRVCAGTQATRITWFQCKDTYKDESSGKVQTGFLNEQYSHFKQSILSDRAVFGIHDWADLPAKGALEPPPPCLTTA